MKPIPGIDKGNGVIDRSTGGLAQTAMIFKSSEKKQEAWEFLKWWTSADVQEQFGTELESLLGVEARWNTANVEALKRLPWSSEDIDSIMEQWQWFREKQIVLGGYYTTRQVANIWNEIVLNGKNQREAIEDGVIAIDKEIRKKREEFGLPITSESTETGSVEGGETMNQTVAAAPSEVKQRAVKRSRVGQLWLDIKKHKISFLFLAPFLILFTTFTIIPVAISFVQSFMYYNIVEKPRWIGWSNFKLLFVDDEVFLKAIANTLKFALVTGPIGYILAFLLAWLISQIPVKYRFFYTLCFYTPAITSGVAISVIWLYFILRR